MRNAHFLLALIAFLCTPLFAAGVYKWTDEKGVVHYTDRPGDREDAKELPGVDARASAAEQASTAAPLPVEEVSAEMLQGLWCEYELASTLESVPPITKNVEWDFYEGNELQYRDLLSGRRVKTTFTVESGQIVTANAEMGSHDIRSYRADLLELGRDTSVTRLRKGGCNG